MIIGKRLKRSDDDILDLCFIDSSDLVNAANFWKAFTNRKYSNLVDATRNIDDPVYWNGDNYVSKIVGSVSKRQLRKIILNFIGMVLSDWRVDNANLFAGKITVEQWQLNGEQRIKKLHIAIWMIIFGGKNQFPSNAMGSNKENKVKRKPSDDDDLFYIISFNVFRYEVLAGKVESGNVAKLPLDSRTDLYANSSYATSQVASRDQATSQGKTEERNILSVADHCVSNPGEELPDCPTQTAKGWVAIGTLPRIGMRKCRGNCLCYLEYR